MQKEQNRYTGEKKNELRHGHGVYRYPNKFFRYEGEWKNGVKHGHGKLVLGDKGYYEGTFENGEIEGHGFKVFGISGASYTGQFHVGEMHGQGLMRKVNGEQYEGCWSHNSREGHGILTGTDGSSYEGEFYNNLKHGEGLQIYSNGDHYEGDWVVGKRHGHGMLRCINGTIYDGQWRNDFYHGEGSIIHASGINYKGMWYNGKPASNAVSLRILGVAGNKGILVEQGKRFGISFECLDQNGRVCKNESGRSFKVSASKRKSNPSHKFRTKVTAVLKNQGIISSPTRVISLPTASSIICLDYELLQIPPNSRLSTPPTVRSGANSPHSGTPRKATQGTQNSTPRIKLPAIESGVLAEDQPRFLTKALTSADLGKCSSDRYMDASPSLIHIGSQNRTGEGVLMSIASLGQTSSSSLETSPKKRKKKAVRDLSNSTETKSFIFPEEDDRKEFSSSDQNFLDGLVKPDVIQTTNGGGFLNDLFMPPAPLQDISHLLPESKSEDFPSATTSPLSKSPTRLKISKQSSVEPPSSPSQVKVKCMKTKSVSSKLLPPKAEKLLQPKRDKYCNPGQYYLTLTEVSNPPYYGNPIVHHVELTVTPQKNEKDVSLDRLIKSRASKEYSTDRVPVGSSKSRLGQLKS